MVDSYSLSDEHQALRAAAGDAVADKMAPFAAEVDETAAFPQAAYDALRAANLHAVHVPSEYGRNGADSPAACIVIEEVAHGCPSSPLMPAVNKLGSLPVIIAGDAEQRDRRLRPLADGEPGAALFRLTAFFAGMSPCRTALRGPDPRRRVAALPGGSA